MKKQNSKTEKIDNSITIVIGCEKTEVITENKKHIQRFIKERERSKKDYRVLIVDFENEYKGTKIGTSELESFKNKVAVIGSSEMTMKQRMDLMEKIAFYYKNGLLIIGNLNGLALKRNNLINLTGALTTNRSKGVDIVVYCGGSFLNIPLKFWQNASYIRLHRTIETNHPTLLPNYEFCQLATWIVRTGRKFVVMDMENGKIFGCPESIYLRGFYSFFVDIAFHFKTLKQLDFLLIGSKYFSDMKQIPISNIYRSYQ
jgi:hypothetical protein